MSHLSVTVGVLATVAQTLTVPAGTPQPSSAARPAVFAGLFAMPTPLPTVQSPPSSRPDLVESAAPRVVCGMVVVPVDAAVDPRMVVQRPSGVTFGMKVIVPPVCVD